MFFRRQLPLPAIARITRLGNYLVSLRVCYSTYSTEA